MVANGNLGHTLADGLNNTGTFVASDHGGRAEKVAALFVGDGQVAHSHMFVRVAEPGEGELHQDLARFGLPEFHFFNGPIGVLCPADGDAGFHGGSPGISGRSRR